VAPSEAFRGLLGVSSYKGDQDKWTGRLVELAGKSRMHSLCQRIAEECECDAEEDDIYPGPGGQDDTGTKRAKGKRGREVKTHVNASKAKLGNSAFAAGSARLDYAQNRTQQKLIDVDKMLELVSEECDFHFDAVSKSRPQAPTHQLHRPQMASVADRDTANRPFFDHNYPEPEYPHATTAFTPTQQRAAFEHQQNRLRQRKGAWGAQSDNQERQSLDTECRVANIERFVTRSANSHMGRDVDDDAQRRLMAVALHYGTRNGQSASIRATALLRRKMRQVGAEYGLDEKVIALAVQKS